MKTVNWHALRLFDLVARYGSITRAADVMFISQPAVTKQIRNLEEELGFRLVETNGRGVALTEAGREVAKLARRLNGIETEVLRYSKRYMDGHTGTVRLAATYLPANHLLPERIARFKRKYPEVQMSCTTSNADQAFRLLLDHEADVAVIGGNAAEPEGLRKRMLKRDEVWFVVPCGHPSANRFIPLGEMLKEPFVLREEGSSMRGMLFALCRTHGLRPPKIGLQVNGLQETIHTIAAGYGAGFVSALEVQDAVKRGVIAKVHVEEAAEMFNSIAVYVREGEHLPPAVSRFYASLLGMDSSV